ncbi:hypothetical protein ACTJKC_22175 [Pedobacter sp. 22226]|uniref:hypothetical protein n=1 Tax=Pedobacter sp. 22226 TaxID=3453894 RepID=UPI003F87CED3
MAIKQTFLSAIIKRLVITILVMTSHNLYAQNSTVLGGKFEVKANFTVKDSVLVISYKNSLPFSQLVWANDFSIAAIFNQSDISGNYLASPITQEIYLVNKDLRPLKTSNSFFLRNDSSELNLYNYRFLDPGEQIDISLKIINDTLCKQIVKKKADSERSFQFYRFYRHGTFGRSK